jgi:hypothetical protein
MLKRWGEGFLDPTSVKRLNPKSILGYLKDIQLTIIESLWVISQKIFSGRSEDRLCLSPCIKKNERWLKTADNFEERTGRIQERKNIMHAHSNSLSPENLQIFPVHAQQKLRIGLALPKFR